MSMQQYCLRWNNHQPNFISVFSSLLNNESLVDVTLAAEGKHLQAHKVVLSACSSYFQSLFTINPCQHPIVILKDVKFLDLKVMVEFMYYGEVNVSQEQLPHILKTAEMLKIKGLAEIPVEQSVAKSQNSSSERAELLTPAESNWSSDGMQRGSLSPSPCPLSPASRRKRLRKSSTGSGSGSAERTSEDHLHTEVTLTSSAGQLSTVIKSDPGFSSDCSTTSRSKHHSTDSEMHRASSHESVEGEQQQHVSLQVPQQEMNLSHTIETTATEVAGPSSHTVTTGIQWGVLDHAVYPHYAATCQQAPPMSSNASEAYCVNNTNFQVPSAECYVNAQGQIQNSPPQIIQKRKRSVNPQADENFVRALEAVRFGGIGFCKAARMYGVNNRTLWLEYKKRGYPNFRLSIKNRNCGKQEQNAQQQVPESGEQQQQQQVEQQQQQQQQQSHNQQQLTQHTSQQQQQNQPPNQQQTQQMEQMKTENPEAVVCDSSQPVALLSYTRYVDSSVLNAQSVNFQGMNFEQM